MCDGPCCFNNNNEGETIRSVEYAYDAYDRRIEKSVDNDGDGPGTAEVERFVYDGEHIALVFDGDGNLTHRYLHGDYVDQVLAEETADGQVKWALSDNQGTVRDVVDGEGNVLNHISYDSFGNVTNETNPDVDFRFGYTGRELDEETGQYYYRARYFDSAVGRFISEDTIGFDAGDANLYRYVFNSPANYIDPTGNVSSLSALLKLTPAQAASIGLSGVAAPVIADGLAPDPAQTPMNPCDIDDTDNSGKRLAISVAVSAGPSLIKGGIKLSSKVFANTADEVATTTDDAIQSAASAVDDSGQSIAQNNAGGTGQISIGRNQSQLDHALRHVENLGLDRTKVQEVVLNDVTKIADKLQPGLNKITSIVDDIEITSHVYKLSDGTINIGRITGPR